MKRWHGLVGALAFATANALAMRTDPLPVVHEPFISFAIDFEGFEQWSSFDVTSVKNDKVHTDGPRKLYLNHRPASGSQQFPVGTIIVKVEQDGPRADWPVFAMVKRGAGYNQAGARGWEWFQLDLPEEVGGTPRIQWRGMGPPDGQGYAGGGDCNQCHVELAADHDAVASTVLASFLR